MSTRPQQTSLIRTLLQIASISKILNHVTRPWDQLHTQLVENNSLLIYYQWLKRISLNNQVHSSKCLAGLTKRTPLAKRTLILSRIIRLDRKITQSAFWVIRRTQRVHLEESCTLREATKIWIHITSKIKNSVTLSWAISSSMVLIQKVVLNQ